MNYSPDSLQRLKQIAADLVQERMEFVKELETDNLTGYSIMKDRVTGEHYLHYAYMHRSFNSREPAEESFHYLLPIESDDVLGMMFGEQGFTYPEHWQQAFLRNGPLGTYVWYDPSGEMEEAESVAMAQQIQERLLRFKQESSGSPEDVGRLMEEFERLRRRKPQDD
jgi:hypothetical protein